MDRRRGIKRSVVLLLLVTFFMGFLVPPVVHAEEKEEKEEKVVRVGWYDSSFCYYDSFGRRCGIAYEYEQKISAYTNWTYEYVEDSWSNLLQMLKDGEIDLLSDVSYTPEREEFMLYPDLPMGTESYYIYVDADNRDISADDVESLNGKRIGVNKDSMQEAFLKEWSEKYDVSVEIVPVSVNEAESMEMVASGELDGYASIFTFDSEQKVIPVARIGG